MYEAYFSLEDPPFVLTPDPRFLLRSKGHLVDTSVLKEHPDGSIVIAVLCRTAGQRTEAAKILLQV